MLSNKAKESIKFITMIGIGVSLLCAGSVTANASNKGYWANYTQKTISYKIKSSSRHYKSIWGKAIKNWNNTKIVRLRSAKTNKKADIHLTTVDEFNNQWKGIFLEPNLTGATSVDSYTWTNIVNKKASRELISKSSVYLNLEKLNSDQYSDKQIVNVATREIGYAMGLTYQKSGVMSKNNRNSQISKTDKKHLAKAYKGYPFKNYIIEPK
ncbi:zinc metalloprotease [Levilactobacillus enshiensis]|uniref:hypothetical protein n=1 Tax=Levilactobacillus enshiensis TaxID=2590213 RepID=UPI00117AB9AC|nr:hypothetical protein [Levilactobacillus enshiensis]